MLTLPPLATRPRVRRRLGALVAAPARPARSRLPQAVDRLGLPADAAGLADTLAVVAIGGPVVGFVVGGPLVASLFAAAVAAGAAVAWRTAPARRDRAYAAALPEVVEAVARHLRAGGSLAQALAAVEPTGSPELAAEWRALAASARVVGVAAALDAWAAHGRPANRLAAAALALAAETGGSPARAVDGVATTLRSRLALADEVRALSSQARASAAVIALAPLAFGAFAGATDDRTAAFFTSPAGAVVLLAGLSLDGAGAWWMGRLCRAAG